MADLFPFGIYHDERCHMVHIGLYADEADCWKTWLGWPDREEIEEAKAQGYVVLPLTLSYTPPAHT